MLQRCIKWQKSWKVGEKMGKKINFPLRFVYVNFKIFSKISNLKWSFAKTRKTLPLGFLISFRIIKDFQNSIKLALICIKISFFKSKFAINSWKFSTFCRFHLFHFNHESISTKITISRQVSEMGQKWNLSTPKMFNLENNSLFVVRFHCSSLVSFHSRINLHENHYLTPSFRNGTKVKLIDT